MIERSTWLFGSRWSTDVGVSAAVFGEQVPERFLRGLVTSD